MDWRAISRSRSRISAMDWRPASRSRSRPPPPGQPFDQGNFSNSWSEGKFAFAAFGDPNVLQNTSLSRSLGSSFVPHVNEYATSSSIPIPGIATQLRHGSPSLTSSLHSQMNMPALYEEDTGLSGTTLVTQCGTTQGSMRPLPTDSYSTTLSALSSPSLQPSSLPSSFGLHGPLRSNKSDVSSSVPTAVPKHGRKTSFDHTVSSKSSSVLSPRDNSGRAFVSGRLLAQDTSLVCNTFYFILFYGLGTSRSEQ